MDSKLDSVKEIGTAECFEVRWAKREKDTKKYIPV